MNWWTITPWQDICISQLIYWISSNPIIIISTASYFIHPPTSVSCHWQSILGLVLQQNSFGSDKCVPISEQRRDHISHVSNIIIVWLLNYYYNYSSDSYILVCVLASQHTYIHLWIRRVVIENWWGVSTNYVYNGSLTYPG